ncbi:GAF domain-containing sensor histidine kinase [Micromonospora sp. NPDC049679]|uniref:GAF domain-containing sensor histidine kinase n=1 Tax=Micromonospora sp. NPDC049679 TaxID=3155920 RepID=UPI0033F83955
MSAPIPSDEGARLAALQSYGLPGDPGTPMFDRIAWLASVLCGAPMSAVSLIYEHEQRFLGQTGLEFSRAPRDISFCAHTLAHRQVLVVPDATADPRFRENPQVTGDPNIRFYAGVPLIDPDGYALGALSVMDPRPRELSADQRDGLTMLGELTVGQLTLRRARAAATDLQRRLAAARTREGEFLSEMAHEVRTPITVIQGYLELLGDGSDPAQLTRIIERVRRNGERLVRLIDDLEAASARRTVGSGPEVSLVDVGAIVTTVVDRCRSDATRAGVGLTLVTDGPALVHVSDGQLTRVAANLVDNAIAFTPAGGRVDVRVTSGPDVIIEVSDTGVGIPPHERRHLFERFFRGAYARDQAIAGLGLGLSVVKAIVDAHGGSVGVESTPAEGTRVRVSLPVGRDVAA